MDAKISVRIVLEAPFSGMRAIATVTNPRIVAAAASQALVEARARVKKAIKDEPTCDSRRAHAEYAWLEYLLRPLLEKEPTASTEVVELRRQLNNAETEIARLKQQVEHQRRIIHAALDKE